MNYMRFLIVHYTIQMENTYISQLLDGTEEGFYLALDLGGTNFRSVLLPGNTHSGHSKYLALSFGGGGGGERRLDFGIKLNLR